VLRKFKAERNVRIVLDLPDFRVEGFFLTTVDRTMKEIVPVFHKLVKYPDPVIARCIR
jgi:hypothetical protein